MTTDTGTPADLERRLVEVVRQQQGLVERLQRDQNHFQGLARSAWRVQEDERRRLARDLHDGIGQSLTAILRLLSESIDALPQVTDPTRLRLEKTRGIVLQTFAETRALSRLLRPQILDELGLEPALRWLARTVGETHVLAISVDIDDDLPSLDSDRNTVIFRVVQEALTNVARHANATAAKIIVRHHGNRISVEIRDDGRGCDVAAALATGARGHGSGVGGMRDRVRLFDGEFDLQSQEGGGCRVIVSFSTRPSAEMVSP